MAAPWGLILYVFAFVFFVFAAFVQPPEDPRRTRLIAGGLALALAVQRVRVTAQRHADQ